MRVVRAFDSKRSVETHVFTFTEVSAELVTTFTKFSVVRQSFDETLRSHNIANKGTTSNIRNDLKSPCSLLLNSPSFYILEASLSSYEHVNTSRFAENAVFKQQQFLNRATCNRLEHGFRNIVITAFQISAIF
jgi:hypothetical protein